MNYSKILNFIKNLSIAGKVISVIVITLISILVIFFSSGCAYKFHADNIDNITSEFGITK